MAANSQIQPWQTNLVGKIHPAAVNAFRLLYDAIQDHDTAIVGVNTKVTNLTQSTSAASSSSILPVPPSVPAGSFPYLGDVNPQTGATYSTSLTDNGGLIVLSYAGAIAVTLASTVTAPFFVSVLNLGTGNATLTPSTGTVNNGASQIVLPAGWAVLYFDGTNWWSFGIPVFPVTKAAVSHKWLASYSAATGAFTQTQPAFTDISGTLAAGQLPATGISVTITTAALTALGAQGSATYVDGILTASTPAT